MIYFIETQYAQSRPRDDDDIKYDFERRVEKHQIIPRQRGQPRREKERETETVSKTTS